MKQKTVVLIVRDRETKEWAVVPDMFESCEAADRHFMEHHKKECDAARWYDFDACIRNFADDPISDLIGLAERLTASGEIGDGMVAHFRATAARAKEVR